MANTILDYIKKTKNETLADRPFNEVDSLILCQFSYLKFDGMVPGIGNREKAVTMLDIFENNDYENLYADERYEKNNRALFEAMLVSKRFYKMKIHSFINIIDLEIETQFAAVTFEFEDGTIYVAFRGTDENLVGWKEDLNLALSAPIPGQLRSVEYLENVAPYLSGDFIVGGHSKGGNLSVFSSMYCSDEIADRIIEIYNHDGPGLRPELFDGERYKFIKDRIRMSVPKSSLVGMLLANCDNYEVVESKNPGLLQHDPFSWKVKNYAFILADSVKEMVALRDKSINEWVLSLSQEQIKFFVDTTYNIMLATGEDNLNGIMKNWTTVVANVLEALKDIDPQAREMLISILNDLREQGEENARVELDNRVEELKQRHADLAEQIKTLYPAITEKISEIKPAVETKLVEKKKSIRKLNKKNQKNI